MKTHDMCVSTATTSLGLSQYDAGARRTRTFSSRETSPERDVGECDAVCWASMFKG
jgi:hypothetical protein